MGLRGLRLLGQTEIPWAQRVWALRGFCSGVTLAAHRLHRSAPWHPRRAAWYSHPAPTLADALARVRRTLGTRLPLFAGRPSPTDSPKIPRPPPERLLDALCYTA